MNSKTRNMLALGASALAIGLSSPALAGVTTTPGVDQIASAAPFASIERTLTISDIGTVGEVDEDYNDDGVAIASVDSVASGQVYQRVSATAFLADDATGNIVNEEGGSVEILVGAIATSTSAAFGEADLNNGIGQQAFANNAAELNLTNSGDIGIGAIATVDAASNSTDWAAVADARVNSAIRQTADGVNSGSVALENTATGSITVVAEALAETSNDGALAYSRVEAGINQDAYGDAASATLDNAGDLNIVVLAGVSSADYAVADVNLYEGISQYAVGDSASISLTNSGELNIGGFAYANGSDAYAYADEFYAIRQDVSADSADGLASVSLTNDGTVSINALAAAAATSSSDARADVEMNGIRQYADAVGGANLAMDMTNNGSIEFAATAVATGGADGYAQASVDIALYQRAEASDGGNADLTITNAGEVVVSAMAAASGSDTANAYATIDEGIYQNAFAYGGGDITATISNSGDIAISAAAAVNADFGYAQVQMDDNVSQAANAYDGGSVTLLVDNAGTISVNALAGANAIVARADATITNVVEQTGFAYDGGNASVTLANTGTITGVAAAEGYGNNTPVNAIVNDALHLVAGAFTSSESASGNATATLTNSIDGVIAIGAVATGTAGSYADVSADNNHAVSVTAFSETGNADAVLSNDGSIAISATANSLSESGADATARVDQAILLGAYSNGEEGLATAALTNSNDIQVNALANATATTYYNAYADAYVSGPLAQYVETTNGAGAAITLDNTGTIAFAATANANATDFTADAFASMYYGLSQWAYSVDGGDISIALTNSGSLSIDLAANAVAGEDAVASAYANYAPVAQYAWAYDGGNADTVLTNSGDLSVSFIATADGGQSAVASVNMHGIYQSAWAEIRSAEEGGTASSLLTNDSDGVISIYAAAIANAGTDNAWASADLNTAVAQYAHAEEADATASLVNAGTIEVTAVANASGSEYAGASAWMWDVVGNWAETYGGGNATASLNNAGSISLLASADAAGTYASVTSAGVASGVTQWAHTVNGGDALSTLNNTGSITVESLANAVGEYHAWAEANNIYAVRQNATADGYTSEGSAIGGNASVELTNASTGIIDLSSKAVASATGSSGYLSESWQASASAQITGVYQYAQSDVGNASITLTNNGSLSVLADASAAAAGTDAWAFASVQTGIHQEAISDAVDGEAANALTNAGTIDITSRAKSVSGAESTSDDAYARATIYTAVLQEAEADVATNALTNSGTINITGMAEAVGDETATAEVSAYGLYQIASGLDGANTLTNTSTGKINASAHATGTAVGAEANAWASAIYQASYGSDSASSTVTNAGLINVVASADVAGSSYADGYAGAYAIQQDGADGTVNSVVNSGTINAEATVNTGGSSASGWASAWDYDVGVDGEVTLAFNNTNTGVLTAKAKTVSDEYAGASAGAVWVGATSITGTITNSGRLTVTAEVEGTSEEAYAQGIVLDAAENTATVNNSGTITVSTKGTGEGSYGYAAGIRVLGAVDQLIQATTTTGDEEPAPVLTINNTGTIIVRQSIDNGASWQHGTAIDLTDAPNAVALNLKGGSIYGNIELSDDDVITVSTGVTSFDGVVNSGGDLVGTLNIAAGGTLYLLDEPTANTSYDGAAQVNVDDLDIAGTLALQLPSLPSGAGSYPTIVANTADIAGATLQIRPSSSNGLYANSYTFDNVIDAEELTGTFATVTTLSGTPLLRFTAVYDAGDNVDLTMTRVAFGAVGGLTTNQSEAGNGIESVYSPTMAAGPFATMLSSLFTLNTANYTAALDQLHGSQYASYLQSLTTVGGRFNSLLNDAAECAATDASKACRAESAGIWGKINYGRTTKDGDANASAYKSNEWFMALGADVKATDALVLGVAGAYVKNDLKFDQYHGRIKGDGYQLGGYASFDQGQYYLNAAVSYSNLNGKAQRTIAIPSIASGTLTAEPDASVWTFSGQAGYRLPLAKASILTPYAGIEHTNAKLNAFDETGVAVANLAVEGGERNRTASLAGIKWSGSFGKIVPQIDLGWRHQFGDLTASVLQSYKIASGSDFTAISQTEKADTAVVGLSVGGEISKGVSFRVGYQGRFNGDVESHSGGITLTAKLGGGN